MVHVFAVKFFVAVDCDRRFALLWVGLAVGWMHTVYLTSFTLLDLT